jgi:hypothetical protein
MHGLKKDIDLNFLNGRELIQVAIGMHQVIFAFDEDVAISVEGEFTYSNGKNTVVWKPGTPDAAATTVALLGTRIESTEGHQNGTLALTFSGGNRLTIPDSSREYESYQITRPGETIVV